MDRPVTVRRHSRPASIVLVGAGPRGCGLLERLLSNAAEFAVSVEVHLVDPFPPGGGRVWRSAQSELLRLNTTAEDLSAYTDDSVIMEGPVTPGPTMYEWCRRYGRRLSDPTLADEAAVINPLEFPSRRLANAYFSFVQDELLHRVPESWTITTHATRAVDLISSASGQELVLLEDGSDIFADAVVLSNSHVDVSPAPMHAELARFAERHQLTYLPPGYGGDLDLERIPAQEDVLVRGFGLGFVDLMILLTEGRGGRFESDANTVTYHPSGREPRLLVGSRRGVPYHCKPMYHLRHPKQHTNAFCTPGAVADLLGRGSAIDFRRDLWPLIGREVSWAYYRELCLGHPGRVRADWTDFAAGFAELAWGSEAFDSWIESVVPDPEDRLDLLALDRPLRGRTGLTSAELAYLLRGYIQADLDRRQDASFSADLAAFHALLAVLPVIGPAMASPLLDPLVLRDDVLGWFLGFFNFYASGPPPDRLHQLLALERAGIVSFLGADLQIETDHDQPAFVARSSSTPDLVRSTALIEATLPVFHLDRTTDPLLRALAGRGEVSGQVLHSSTGAVLDTGALRVGADFSLLRADGTADHRRFALGMHTTARSPAFARPGSNSAMHRQNDHLARQLLSRLHSASADPQPQPGRPWTARALSVPRRRHDVH